MTCHCSLGMSARAIAYKGHTDHPHDPSDLLRCIQYCKSQSISTAALRKRMAGRSPEWDALLPQWDELVALLNGEIEWGTAPVTYARMRALLATARAS